MSIQENGLAWLDEVEPLLVCARMEAEQRLGQGQLFLEEAR